MRTILFPMLILLAFCSVANGQSAIYKHFAKQSDLKVYCVEHYPLTTGDSVNVTLITTDDSLAYAKLRAELFGLHYTPSLPPTPIEKSPSSENAFRQHTDSIAHLMQHNKHLVCFNADALPGDKGFYTIYLPSDRLSALIFLIRNDEEHYAVTRHMMATEFPPK